MIRLKVALLFAVIFPDALKAQSLNRAVVGAVRGITRAEINGILSRGRYDSAGRNQYQQRGQAFSDSWQPRQQARPTGKVILKPVLPADNNKSLKRGNKLSEQELNSVGWQSF